MTSTGGADGVRQIRRHGQCIPFGSNRSAAPHRHFAKVTGRKSGDHECRWIERDGHISLHRLRLDPGSGICSQPSFEGFVEFDENSKAYSLGLFPVFLARRALGSEHALELASPLLQAMADEHRCVSALWKLSLDRLVLLKLFDSRSLVNIHIEVGQRLPSLIGAMGRCVAASQKLDRKVLKMAFDKLNWQCAPSFADYASDIALARDRGWAADIDNFARGITTVAAAISDQSSTVRYCISNVLFSGQVEIDRIESLGNQVAGAARQLANELYG